jgi:hypothetical protein
MRIFVHIGAEKTGTSSVQQFFRRNRDKLKSAGYLYPEAHGFDSHMGLAAACQNDDARDDLRMIFQLDSVQKIREFRVSLSQQMFEESQAGEYSHLILSSEHCSSRLVSLVEVERLAKILRRISRDIIILVYIRRQDEFLCSSYSTDVKSGFGGRMTLPGEELRRNRYDYFALLRRWSSVFGKENIVCRIYDEEHLKGGDIVDDVADAMGLVLTEEYSRPPRANESLDVTALEFLRLFNATVPVFRDNVKNAARGNIVQALKSVSDGPMPALTDRELAEFMRHFRDSNMRVAREYFGKVCATGDPLFGEALEGKNRAEMKPISVETAVQLAAALWSQKQEQISDFAARQQKMRDRIKRLEELLEASKARLAESGRGRNQRQLGQNGIPARRV